MFVHLRLHTEFSVVDSTIRVDAAAEMACADGQGALAITDLNNLFATVKFYRACRDLGVKPLVGAEVSLEGLGADAAQGSRIVLLVQNALIRRAFRLRNSHRSMWCSFRTIITTTLMCQHCAASMRCMHPAL